MLTPANYDLPAKFTHYRPGQLETAAMIAGSQSYAFLLDAPTGIGKSLIAGTVQRIRNERVTYLCTTKQLQDQLLHDFPYARTVKGRSNYKCLRFESQFPTISADNCTHGSAKCPYFNVCPYVVAKREALSAPIAVLNMAYFLNEANLSGGDEGGSFSGLAYLIVDEFDQLEDQLMSFVEVKITQRMLDRLQLDPPQFKTKFEAWRAWADQAIGVLRKQEAELQAKTAISSWSTIDIQSQRRLKEVSRLLGKLRFFVNEVDDTWVWYPNTTEWSFKPVWIAKYANANIWRHTKKLLGMSATLLDPDQICSNVGLGAHWFKPATYMALESPFPVENRPVFYWPVAELTRDNKGIALPRIVRAVETIMNRYQSEKILVHTVSYEIRDSIMKNIKSSRFITHATQDRVAKLEQFRNSPRPLVMLSPSMDRGVDLPYDACRVVVITKMPYPYLGDPQIKKRVYGSKDGNEWYTHRTIATMVQMAGRGVRTPDDTADTYILDAQFDKLLKQNRRMFPKWFMDAIVRELPEGLL